MILRDEFRTSYGLASLFRDTSSQLSMFEGCLEELPRFDVVNFHLTSIYFSRSRASAANFDVVTF